MSIIDIRNNDCLIELREINDESIDAIVTDPPYGLSFMGKRWDYDVPSVEIWTECLRVLKPGGHLLSFAGTRTQHRMAVRIEDAGFEIRDMIAWVYGSGFPKSLDVSKAIDKAAGRIGQSVIDLKKQLIALADASGMTRAAIDAACGFRATNYMTLPAERKRPDPWVNCLPPRDKWATMKRVLGADNSLDEVFTHAEREVVGVKRAAPGVAFSSDGPTELDITAPATENAKRYDGWGTALKPALEPITVARKPLIGTVAENVLAHGTGALNIDGCRVGDEVLPTMTAGQAKIGTFERGVMVTPERTGRWPANLIHDGGEYFGEQSRFFYCAKASKKDRGENNNHPTVKPTDLMRYLCRLVTPPNGVVLDPFMGSGSTGKAAVLEGLNFVGIEKDPDYFCIAKERIEAAQ